MNQQEERTAHANKLRISETFSSERECIKEKSYTGSKLEIKFPCLGTTKLANIAYKSFTERSIAGLE